jgi:hypothetical protein
MKERRFGKHGNKNAHGPLNLAGFASRGGLNELTSRKARSNIADTTPKNVRNWAGMMK